MNQLISSFSRTSVFLYVAFVLQACGEGATGDGVNTAPSSIQAGAEPSLSPFASITVGTNDFEVVSNSNLPTESSDIELGAATEATNSVAIVSATLVLPSEAATNTAVGEEIASSSADSGLPTDSTDIALGAATEATDTVAMVSATPQMPPEVSTITAVVEETDIAVAAATEQPVVLASEERNLTTVEEVPEVGAALPVETSLESIEAPSSLSVDPVVDSENVQPLIDSDAEATVDATEVPVSLPVDNTIVSENEPLVAGSEEDVPVDPVTAIPLDDQNIILGSSAGDAVCLHLGDEDKGFTGVSDSDWNRWVSEFHFSIGEEFLAVEPQDDGSTALRQRFIPSSIGTDRAVVGARLPEHRTYRLTQSFYLEPGFDWGGTQEGGKLGFGFAGGTKATGGTIDPNGFSSRLMWRGNKDGTGRIVLYSYAADRSDRYGDDIRYGSGNISIGEWFTVIMEVTANSSTQVSDGSVRGWIDGELVLDQENIGWQLAGDTPLIDYLYYSGFYGGNSSDWSPSSTTHMKARDVCWAAVVDGYSGIDPDNGRLVVATTENPDGLFNDGAGENELEAIVRERQRALVSILEETLINIRSVAPVAPFLVQQYYDEVITELNAVIINTDKVTNSSLSVNPVPLLKSANEQLEFSLTVNNGDNLQTTAIMGVQKALQVAYKRSSELAVAVVNNKLNDNSCSNTTPLPGCSVADEISLEINAHLESIRYGSTSTAEATSTAEVIWNRSVDALNSLD